MNKSRNSRGYIKQDRGNIEQEPQHQRQYWTTSTGSTIITYIIYIILSHSELYSSIFSFKMWSISPMHWTMSPDARSMEAKSSHILSYEKITQNYTMLHNFVSLWHSVTYHDEAMWHVKSHDKKQWICSEVDKLAVRLWRWWVKLAIKSLRL